jgi:hypothetical protein
MKMMKSSVIGLLAIAVVAGTGCGTSVEDSPKDELLLLEVETTSNEEPHSTPSDADEPTEEAVTESPVEVEEPTHPDVLEPPSRTALPLLDGVPPGDPTVLALGDVLSAGFERFVTSTACSMCHSNSVSATAMRDSKYRDIGPFNLWQGTMMANSARDPLWHAAVSMEVQEAPSRAATTEAKCIRCHAPMASVTQLAKGNEVRMKDLFEPETGPTVVGLDGVACAVCHQIKKDNLGTDESFSGGFEIGTERLIFGPHKNPATGPMQHHVDYTPTYGPHVATSEMCATCHTLFTTPIRRDGTEVQGVQFPEQTTYLEWKNSDYRDENVTCQACHMPTVDEEGEIIETRIARAPPGFDFNIFPREPFGRHIFTGANTLIPSILKAERAILNPVATDEAFDATIENARRYLQEKALAIRVTESRFDGETYSLGVRVENFAGHKFPTGIPIRRGWLRVTVRNKEGMILFRSGAFDKAGRLVDQNGAILDIEKTGGGWEPHRTVIKRHDEVQVYEGIMADSENEQTYSLVRAATYLKDNRILPRGFRSNTPAYAQMPPVGVENDDDFGPGADEVRYKISIGQSSFVRVDVAFFYQTASARYVNELFQVDTPEVRAFRTMYERADLTPTQVGTTYLEQGRD